MSTVRFVLRIDKPNKDGACPIQLIYQISGQRKYFKTKQRLFPQNWEPGEQKAIYLDKKAAKKLLQGVDYDQLPSFREVDETNNTLTSIRKEISNIERRFELNKVVYSPEMVIEQLDSQTPITKKEAPSNELFAFIDKYIEDHTATREPGSLSVYKSLKNHLQNFQKDKNKKITFDKIDYAFFIEFQAYLIGTRKLNNTTVAKQLSTIKTFLNYARMQGLTILDKYKDFKIRRETLEVIALTAQEFESLFNHDLTGNKRLDQVRDVFCFACVTGLRYSDLQQLKREHIKSDEIRLIVKKTKEPLSIPLNPYSSAILDKYKDKHKPLPIISNQKLNVYIKELCELVKINEMVEIVRFRGAERTPKTYQKHELISIHTGRKTFATLSLEKGMSAEEVMTITGHRDYKSFKRYVKITEQRKKVVMHKAWGSKLSAGQLKVV